jgi:putative addiction module killer protein
MVDVRTTPEFDDWLASLADQRAYTKVLVRISRYGEGLLRGLQANWAGLSESRIHHGPGYRLYFARRGRDLVVLLAGGDKSSQRRDVVKAKRLAAGL